MWYYRFKIKTLRKSAKEASIYYQPLSLVRICSLVGLWGSMCAGLGLTIWGYASVDPTYLIYKVLLALFVVCLLTAFYFQPQNWQKIILRYPLVYTTTHNSFKLSEVKGFVIRNNQNKFYVAAALHNYEIPVSGAVSKNASKKIINVLKYWQEKTQSYPNNTIVKKPQIFHNK